MTLKRGEFLVLRLEAADGFEPPNNGFADRRLTTWLTASFLNDHYYHQTLRFVNKWTEKNGERLGFKTTSIKIFKNPAVKAFS